MSHKSAKTQIPYEEWMELQFSLDCISEEMREVEEFLKRTDVPADEMKEAQERLKKLEEEYAALLEKEKTVEPEEDYYEEEREQFDFGDSAADW